MFDRCPVGTSYTLDAMKYLAAYNIFKNFGIYPPGRRDPKLLEAFMVIQSEHNAILAEGQNG